MATNTMQRKTCVARVMQESLYPFCARPPMGIALFRPFVSGERETQRWLCLSL